MELERISRENGEREKRFRERGKYTDDEREILRKIRNRSKAKNRIRRKMRRKEAGEREDVRM